MVHLPPSYESRCPVPWFAARCSVLRRQSLALLVSTQKIIPALAGTKSGAIEGVARAGELRNKTSMETDARGSDASENLRL